MKDSVSEAGEIADAITNACEDLRFVVAAFRIAVGIANIKSIENVLAPVVDGSGAFVEFWKMSTLCTDDPIMKEFSGDFGVG